MLNAYDAWKTDDGYEDDTLYDDGMEAFLDIIRCDDEAGREDMVIDYLAAKEEDESLEGFEDWAVETQFERWYESWREKEVKYWMEQPC